MMCLLIVLEFLYKLDYLGLVGGSFGVELNLQLLFGDLDLFVFVELDTKFSAILFELFLFLMIFVAPAFLLLHFWF